jgi:hypothetical protein
MPQFYVSEDNASAVRRCNQSRRTGEAISVCGLDLSGSFSGVHFVVQIDRRPLSTPPAAQSA